MEDTASTSDQTYKLTRANGRRFGSFLKGIINIAELPLQFIIAHFVIAAGFIVVAQGTMILLEYIDYSREKAFGTEITVKDIMNTFEVIWLLAILSIGLYKGAKALLEAQSE